MTGCCSAVRVSYSTLPPPALKSAMLARARPRLPATARCAGGVCLGRKRGHHPQPRAAFRPSDQQHPVLSWIFRPWRGPDRGWPASSPLRRSPARPNGSTLSPASRTRAFPAAGLSACRRCCWRRLIIGCGICFRKGSATFCEQKVAKKTLLCWALGVVGDIASGPA